jgi:hypothetical protein
MSIFIYPEFELKMNMDMGKGMGMDIFDTTHRFSSILGYFDI